MFLKKHKSFFLFFIILFCFTFGLSNITRVKAVGENWLTGYGYRKQITISNSTGAGTNYQINVTIRSVTGSDTNYTIYTGGNCSNFPNDIRFTEDDGDTELDHWGNTINATTETFWIEISDNLDSTNVIIYFYYESAGKPSASNGDNTFLFFDDFTGNNGDVWDNAKWLGTQQDGATGGSIFDIQGNEGRSHYGSGGGWSYMGEKSVSNYSFGLRINWNAKPFLTAGSDDVFTALGLSSSNYTTYLEGQNNWLRLVTRHDGGSTAFYLQRRVGGGGIATISSFGNVGDLDGVMDNWEFLIDATNVKWLQNDITKYSGAHGINFATTYIAFEHWSPIAGFYDGFYDSLFIGKYIDPEPTIINVGIVEYCSGTPPKNISCVIINIESNNNTYVNMTHYIFRATAQDNDMDLANISISFYDNREYSNFTFTVATGVFAKVISNNITDLDTSSCTNSTSGNSTIVNFHIMMINGINPRNDTDINMWSRDDFDTTDGWENINSNYFNIVYVSRLDITILGGEAVYLLIISILVILLSLVGRKSITVNLASFIIAVVLLIPPHTQYAIVYEVEIVAVAIVFMVMLFNAHTWWTNRD